MINMEVRKLFKDMPGYNGMYKINYLGDVYSTRIKRLKKTEVYTNKYLLRTVGNFFCYSKKDIQKIFFSTDASLIRLDNIYKDTNKKTYIDISLLDTTTEITDRSKHFSYFKSIRDIIDIYNTKKGIASSITSNIKFDTSQQYETKRYVFQKGSELDIESVLIIYNLLLDPELGNYIECIANLFDIDIKLLYEIKDYIILNKLQSSIKGDEKIC